MDGLKVFIILVALWGLVSAAVIALHLFHVLALPKWLFILVFVFGVGPALLLTLLSVAWALSWKE